MRHKAVLLLAFISCLAPVHSTDLIWRNPSHGSFFWWEISVTADAFYVPSRGGLLKSTNASDWTLHYQPSSGQIFSIAQSPDKLLAVASYVDASYSNVPFPAFFISTNGVDFKFLKEAPHHVYKIVYGKGRFVTSGFEMSQSDNGLNWSRITQIPTATDPSVVGDLLFANDRFLRATATGIYVSDDGVSWTQTAPPSLRLSFYNGVYVAAGENTIRFSDDGYTWRNQSVTTPKPVRALAIGAPGTIAVGDSINSAAADAIFSADGTNWINFTLPFSNRTWDIKFINGQYVMVGDGGLIACSTDGTHWTKNSPLPSLQIYGTAKSEDRLLAVGADIQSVGAGIWTTNGLTWQPLPLGAAHILTSISYRNGTFVAVGFQGQTLVSTNGGEQWIEPARVTTQDLYAVAASPRGFVAVGRVGAIIASTNGLNWEVLPPVNFTLLDIAYGNGLYIATASGDDGGAMISTDLQTWNFVAWPYRGAHMVEFGNGHFVLGPYGYVSADGTNWVQGLQGSGLQFDSLTFSEGVFCAQIGPLATFWNAPSWADPVRGNVSVDGLRWHQFFEISYPYVRPGRYFGRFLSFCPDSGILEIDDFGILDLSRNPEGTLNLQPIHPAKFTSQIETSTNLVAWTTMQQPAPLPTSSNPNQFFRLKLENPSPP